MFFIDRTKAVIPHFLEKSLRNLKKTRKINKNTKNSYFLMSVASLCTPCFVMFCVFLHGSFCQVAHKLDMSTLFTTFFSLNIFSIYIFNISPIYITNLSLVCVCYVFICPRTASVCSYFSGPQGSWVVCCLHLKIEFRSCARRRQWCGIFYYHWWTASIKPRLLFPM